MAMAEEAVRVRRPRERSGAVTAPDGVDLGIRQGEVVGLLGPDGAGKSTTVETLQGQRSRDAGEVAVLGRGPASGGRGWRSRVGTVWQDESAPAELTVRARTGREGAAAAARHTDIPGRVRPRHAVANCRCYAGPPGAFGRLAVADRTAAVTSAMRLGLP